MGGGGMMQAYAPGPWMSSQLQGFGQQPGMGGQGGFSPMTAMFMRRPGMGMFG